MEFHIELIFFLNYYFVSYILFIFVCAHLVWNLSVFLIFVPE